MSSSSLNLILIGPPGSGKGTQSLNLTRKYGICHLATGDMLREAVDKGTSLGKKIETYMAQGKFPPEEDVIQLVSEKLSTPDCSKGVLFDGFPRTLNQAKKLDEIFLANGEKITCAILLDVDEEQLVERISGRYLCSQCNTAYHNENKKPQVDGVCDVCGSKKFARRKDDKREVIETRLSIYNDMTAPLIPYYKERGSLSVVNGMASIASIEQDIEAIVAKKMSTTG